MPVDSESQAMSAVPFDQNLGPARRWCESSRSDQVFSGAFMPVIACDTEIRRMKHCGVDAQARMGQR